MKNPFKFNAMRFFKRHDAPARGNHLRSCFRRDEQGATVVEFAFVFPAFIALVFFVMQSALTYWTHHTLDFGVHETARLVRTGQVTNASLTKHKFKEMICEFVAMNKTECVSKIAIELRPMPSTPDYSPPEENGELDDQNAAYNSGARGSLMMLKAFLPAEGLEKMQKLIRIISGSSQSANDDIILRSVALFRNEP